MTILKDFTDDGPRGCFANVRMDNGDPLVTIVNNNYLKLLFRTIIFLILFQSDPAHSQITHEVFMNSSYPLSNQLGKVYQMQLNCKQNPELTPRKSAGLFINYMTEEQVQMVMMEYSKGMKKMKGWKCDKQEAVRTMKALLESMAMYIRLAQPFMKPY